MKYFILMQMLFLSIGLHAQSNEQMAMQSDDTGWIKFQSEFKTPAMEVFVKHKSAFGLAQEDKMKLVRQESDKLGFEHYRFQQLHKGIKVEGAEIILHTKEDKVVSGNGSLASGIQVNMEVKVSKEEAIEIGKKAVPAKLYMWENEAENELLRQIKKDNDASYFPKPEMVIVSKNFENDQFVLAWKFEIFSALPMQRKVLYVDAQIGEIVAVNNRIKNADVEGTAITAFSGERAIVADSYMGGFRLKEEVRGGGIHTLNMNLGVSYVAADEFWDGDNVWNNVNPQLDQYATDAHWGTEIVYDYYLETFDRDSYDNEGGMLLNYVHADLVGMGLPDNANAFWDGGKMVYGDGGGTFAPFTSIDIVGHEITHGVVDFTANLIYQKEPGALNESFSDIFGNVIEQWAKPEDASWRIGEEITADGLGIRNMQNPKNLLQPDTYGGTYWINPECGTPNGGNDFCGVHTNSGVQNFWFYLLSEGSVATDGINDNGEIYSISGIGIEAAAAIAYRTLSIYLTNTSKYIDARMGSIQAAADLFGECSFEATEVAAAWDAVGVYDNGQCPKYLTIPDLPIPFEEYQAQSCISSTGLVQDGSDVQMHAGKSVYLKPGFTADLGADFYAFIEGCTKSENLVAPENGILSISSDAIQTKEIEERKELLTIKNYPNPSAGFMNFEFELANTFLVNLEVFDVTGHLVANPIKDKEFDSGVHIIPFDGQYLDEGIYFYRFTTDQEIITQKLIVNR